MSTENLIIEPMRGSCPGVQFSDSEYKLYGRPIVVAQLFYANQPGEGALYWRVDVPATLKTEVEEAARRILKRRETAKAAELQWQRAETMADIHYLQPIYPNLI